MESAEGGKTNVKSNTVVHRGGNQFVCDICGKGSANMTRHLTTVHLHIKPYQCPVCHKRFGEAGNMKHHLRRMHSAPKIGKIVCTEELRRPTSCRPINELEQRDGNQFVCDICGKVSARMFRHLTTVHLRIKPYQCPVCQRRFGQTRSMKDHWRRLHSGPKIIRKIVTTPAIGEAVFKCSECDKAYTTVAGLKQHVNNKHIGTNYQCPICNKYFTQSGDLRRHKETIHDGVKRHQCPDCGVCYSRVHTNCTHSSSIHERHKFVCELCGKQFNRKDCLKAHSFVHSGIRTFMCDICGRGFTLATNLSIHCHTVHLHIKAHQCPVCQKWFGQSCAMKAHLRNVH